MKKQLILILSVGTIIILSFLLFSSVFYPLFNSDDGVTVLMLHYFKLPRDLYFWNQDRVGSIIPLIGQLFYKGLGLSSLWSESIAHYLILILGYLSLSTLLKSNFSKIVFAVIWFFPIMHFIGLVRYTFGLQYSLVGMAIYLMNKYPAIKQSQVVQRLSLLIAIFLLFVLSAWVSDGAIVTSFIIIVVTAYFSFKSTKSMRGFLFRLETVFTVISGIMGLLIVYYLKSIARISPFYTYNEKVFNSLNEFCKSFAIIKKDIFNVFTFRIIETPESIYAYCVLILFVLMFFFKTRIKSIPVGMRKWLIVFFIDGTVLFILILLSHWALLNGVARRYFTGVYIAYWLAYLIYFDQSKMSNIKEFARIFIVITIIIGSVGTVYSFKYVFPKRLTPKAEIVREFEQLGKIGIISEYWNSYGTSFVNPDLIKATPHDKSNVRNYDLVDSVFNQPKLFVIKDMWMDSFPGSMNQFGHRLIRKGKGFYIGDCWVCEYVEIVEKMP
jgi:hypothetical protein